LQKNAFFPELLTAFCSRKAAKITSLQLNLLKKRPFQGKNEGDLSLGCSGGTDFSANYPRKKKQCRKNAINVKVFVDLFSRQRQRATKVLRLRLSLNVTSFCKRACRPKRYYFRLASTVFLREGNAAG
jgi:hypothetical protein